MSVKKIDEEEGLIYDDDGEGFDKSNVLEEHTASIKSDKTTSSGFGQPPTVFSRPPFQLGGVGCPNYPFLERVSVWPLNTAVDCHRLGFLSLSVLMVGQWGIVPSSGLTTVVHLGITPIQDLQP